MLDRHWGVSEEINPYAAPQSEFLFAKEPDGALPHGSRGRRLVASLIDSLIVLVIFMPLQFLTGTFQREFARQQAGAGLLDFNPENLIWSAAGFLLIVAINWGFLANGQTIGKKALGLRIDAITGGVCERSRIITRRMLVLQIIYLIPGVNFLFMFVDCMMIFREDRRTLHDMIAGTRVVDIRQGAAASV